MNLLCIIPFMLIKSVLPTMSSQQVQALTGRFFPLCRMPTTPSASAQEGPPTPQGHVPPIIVQGVADGNGQVHPAAQTSDHAGREQMEHSLRSLELQNDAELEALQLAKEEHQRLLKISENEKRREGTLAEQLADELQRLDPSQTLVATRDQAEAELRRLQEVSQRYDEELAMQSETRAALQQEREAMRLLQGKREAHGVMFSLSGGWFTSPSANISMRRRRHPCVSSCSVAPCEQRMPACVG